MGTGRDWEMGDWAPRPWERLAREAQRCRGRSYTVSGLAASRRSPVSFPREVIAVTLPCSHHILPPQPSPPITVLLLLIIAHPAGFPAAPGCT